MAYYTTLEQKFVELQKAHQIDQNQNLRPKIQKVPQSLRNRKKFEKQYSPKLVSIGPIHHDNPNLKLGEKYKLTWAAKYIESTQRDPQFLHKKIADHIDELKDLFTDDVLALANNSESLIGFRSLEEKLSWLLFVDGCSLMYILLNVKLYEVTPIDAAEHLNIKVDQLLVVMMDVLLLENQLPYLVLKLLWKNDHDIEVIVTMKNFLQYFHWARPIIKSTENERIHIVELSTSKRPTHLLDLQRKIILLTKSNQKIEGVNNEAKKNKKESWNSTVEKYNVMTTSRSIQYLRATGIKVKSSGTRRSRDVDFSEGWFAGELTLPEIIVDDTTSPTFLNLIAYEMCPDFKNDYGICSFAAFMDMLIDHPEDVKELRS